MPLTRMRRSTNSYSLTLPASEEKKSIFESPEFQLDVNYFRVEPTLECHQKESVQVSERLANSPPRTLNWLENLFQGSHVMSHAGHYVLQWTCSEAEAESAQLMFFYEVLSSENYKGSMSNLQSGISAMSLASSCQSR